MSVKNRKRMHRVRVKFLIAQQGRCWLCGAPMLLNVGKNHPLAVTWDHIRPRSKGGGSGQDNLMLAHRRCNGQRGDNEDLRAVRN